MHRNFSLILTIAAILLGCNSKDNDLHYENLEGDVWKVMRTTFEGEEKNGLYQIKDKRYYGHYKREFNEDGNYIKTSILDRNGNVEKFHTYRRDEAGNLIEITTIEDGDVVQTQKNKLKNNLITEIQVYDEDGDFTGRFEYNYTGTEISSVKEFNSDGSLKESFQNKYTDGYLSKKTFRNEDHQIKYIVNFETNKEGDINRVLVNYPRDSAKDFMNSFQYEYDDNGNWLKSYEFDEDGNITDIVIRNIVYYEGRNEVKTENDFIGMWSVIGENGWIELRSNNEYDVGNRDRIRETGTWEMNSKEQILTFRANDPDDSRKYKYDFEGYHMILLTIQGEEKYRLRPQ